MMEPSPLASGHFTKAGGILIFKYVCLDLPFPTPLVAVTLERNTADRALEKYIYK